MDSSAQLKPASAGKASVLKGALYMTLAAALFAVMNLLIREASADVHPFQLAFFRNLFALLFVLPLVLRGGHKVVRTARPRLHFLRAMTGLCAMLLWFSALALLPMSEAVALNFTVPLFTTIGAALFLGEVVRLRRWSATLVGFLGVLIILRPGFAAVTPEMLLPIAAAVFMAASVLLVKQLTNADGPITVVFYMNLFLTPVSLIPALFVWSWPGATTLLMMVAVGGFATLSHLAMTQSYRLADASAVIPFDYARLPFVAILAWFAYDELADFWTWFGAAVIAAAALYIARREAKVAKMQAAALAPRGRL
jgi:drug/metabolite transporter (DMT)-like permease